MIKVYINNEEVLCDKNIIIKEEMLNTSSVILNNVYPKNWETTHDYTTNFFYPLDWSKCTIYDDETLLFSGIVKNSGNISLKPTDPHYATIEVLGRELFLSESITLDFAIVNKTIRQAIEMVIGALSGYGITLGNINIQNADEVIGAYSTEDKTAYDVLQYLAQISEAKWRVRITGENSIAIDFFDPLLEEVGGTVEATTEYYRNNNINDMSYSFGTRDYRNKQIINSKEVFADIVSEENLLSGGATKEYVLEQNVGQISSIIINDTAQTFASKEEKENGVVADFYYEYGSNILESASLWSSGTLINVNYIALVPGREVITTDSEITRLQQQLGITGIISRYEDRDDITSSLDLKRIASDYIKYKGTPEITLTIESQNDLFDIGEIINFHNAPINELSTSYIVKSKETEIIASTMNKFYTFTLVSNFNSENAINWFDNQRNKRSGNITQGQFITRNLEYNDTATIIWQGDSIEPTTITGNNILDCALNSPFVE